MVHAVCFVVRVAGMRAVRAALCFAGDVLLCLMLLCNMGCGEHFIPGGPTWCLCRVVCSGLCAVGRLELLRNP